MDTIFALATARGRAGVAIIRISGPAAVLAAGNLMQDVPKNRGLRKLHDENGDLVDEALVLHFAAKQSFTGEEVIELQLHGSLAIVAAILRLLGNNKELRLADAGEFTRRAMENGCLDLAQVEGLADLIDAETEGQRKQAVRVFSGAIGKIVENWRADLIRAAALLEATIDFADEEVPVDVGPEVIDLVAHVKSAMIKEVAGITAAERIRDGFEVAIIGAPNVGKSTLLNRLARREVAITSEIAGTTRDILEVKMDIDGFAVTVLDTAGIRETDDIVEKIGVARALERSEQADIRIYMVLADDQLPLKLVDTDIVVYAKADLDEKSINGVSGLTGTGVDLLIEGISSILQKKASSAGVMMRERHRLAMNSAIADLADVEIQILDGTGLTELIAHQLRIAINTVDSLVGRIDVEDILGEIFSSFCIGK